MSKFGLWFRWKIILPLLKRDNLRERERLLKKQMDLPKELAEVERKIELNDKEFKELGSYEEVMRKYKEENK